MPSGDNQNPIAPEPPCPSNRQRPDACSFALHGIQPAPGHAAVDAGLHLHHRAGRRPQRDGLAQPGTVDDRHRAARRQGQCAAGRRTGGAGQDPDQLAREVEKVLGKYVRDPVVTVIVTGFVGPYSEQIRVVGEAAKPQFLPTRTR
jgi:hypothetical protein